MANEPVKPIGRKAYGSIGHLPNSRLGPGDHSVSDGQARICTDRPRDKHDRIIVQEKLDGSCVAVAKVRGELHAITRKGWPARTSPFEQHHLFADWVEEHAERFQSVLRDGERIVGEWLAQAHGTYYGDIGVPFVAFDLMSGKERLPYDDFFVRVSGSLLIPRLACHRSGQPQAIYDALRKHSDHIPEGLVYRVERHGKVDFLAKWVRADFVPGAFLPEISGKDAVWNWHPTLPAEY